MNNNLDTLAIKHNTDKSSLFHNYTKIYDLIFSDYKNDPINFMEIGVLNGASIKMWSEYFPNAKIIGVDVDLNCKRFETANISVEIGNQTDLTFLDTLLGKYKTIDIILDDGGHTWKQQKTTFIHLFPHLNNGGYYVIEDLSTSYLKGSVWDTNESTTVEFLKNIIDDVNLNGKSIVGTKEIAGKNLNFYEKAIEYCIFYKGTCIIKKRQSLLDP